MKLFSFSKKENKEVSLVYDIGSASVGCAIVLYSKKDVPKIIYSTRKDIIYQERFDIDRFDSLVIKAVKEVSLDVQKKGLTHLKFTKLGNANPKRIFVTISSPWYASQTRAIKLSENKAFIITEDKINKWIEKEIESFKKSDYIKKYSKAGNLKIIEKRIINIKLNGYDTSNPYGKNAKTFEASVVLSVSTEDIIKKIDDTICSIFNCVQVEFNSFPLVAFSVIRDMDDSFQDFIFLDISGEITDVLVSKSGVPFEVSTFPIGKNNIIRGLSEALNTNKEEATSLLSLFVEDNLSGSEVVRVGNAFNKIRSKWVMSFQKSLENISEDFSIPSLIFFTSDNDLNRLFEDSIKSEQFSQFTMSDKPFVVRALDVPSFNKNIKLGGHSKADPFLVINSVFFNKLV